MPLNIKTAIDLDNKRRESESLLLRSSVIDNSTRDLLKNSDQEFKDKILEAILSQIISNPQLKEKFIAELITK
ncbi:MAG: hypothetical protein QW778_03595 [Candidatus Micrarchaeaceae archaeon]